MITDELISSDFPTPTTCCRRSLSARGLDGGHRTKLDDYPWQGIWSDYLYLKLDFACITALDLRWIEATIWHEGRANGVEKMHPPLHVFLQSFAFALRQVPSITMFAERPTKNKSWSRDHSAIILLILVPSLGWCRMIPWRWCQVNIQQQYTASARNSLVLLGDFQIERVCCLGPIFPGTLDIRLRGGWWKGRRHETA